VNILQIAYWMHYIVYSFSWYPSCILPRLFQYNNDVKHIKILTKEGFFYIAENRKFRSILELIEYYKHHSLREGFRTLDTTLQFAYREPENGANMFTPKVMGVAIACYDFSSRDTRELSLQEGDVVKIYSKTGANGWWRGEVNGRVSVFPENRRK
uniref:Guanine nucleotide exchange factor VAV3-like n=1 Tax=Sinocyclocheilus anshuiensis TaxID=1608454 RepID=A0A671NBK1_9TELE